MAYMNQEKKTEIANALKAVMPKGWKYSLAVRHHSTIVCTISVAPVDLLSEVIERIDPITGEAHLRPTHHLNVNTFALDAYFDGALLETFKAIAKALNTDNFDRSDIQSDYFNVGHYVDLSIGRWDRAFQHTGAPKAAMMQAGAYPATDWTGAEAA